MNARGLQPFVRIALYCLSTWLMSAGVDSEIVDQIRHPETVGAAVAVITLLWYTWAKKHGGPT